MEEQKSKVRHSFIKGKVVAIPTPREVLNNGTNVLFWGKFNEYPYFLNSLHQQNSMHGGIINSKVIYISGGGVEYEGNNLESFENLFYNVNDLQNLEDLIMRSTLDFEIANTFCLKFKRSPFGQKDVISCEVIPYEKIRFKVYEDENKNIILDESSIYISDNWLDGRASRYEELTNNIEENEFFYLYKEVSSSSLEDINRPSAKTLIRGIYPTPVYSGGVISIMTGIAISKYQNNEITNNFSLGTIINFNNGKPQVKDEQDKIEKDIIGMASGEENAGGIFISYNYGKEKEVTVEHVNGNNLNERYNNSDTHTRKNILTAHSITTPILFGYKEEGSLGNATELETGYLIMQSNYFNQRRKVIESCYNYVLNKIYGIEGKIIIKQKELNFPKDEAEPLFELTPQKKFKKEVSEEDKLIDLFSNCGRNKDTFKIIFKEGYNYKNENFSKHNFITTNEIRVLSLIADGNDFNSVRKALNISTDRLVKIYKELKEQDLISPEGNSITRQGAFQIAQSNIELIETVFSYELREGVEGPEVLPDGRTRDFCRRLIELNKVYTREEIERISSVMGYNVFGYAGGWYNNPKTKKTTPWCRHEWKLNIVTING